MRLLDVSRDGLETVRAVLRRDAVLADPLVAETVAGIVEDVRVRGDSALLELSRKFDAPALDSLIVAPSAIASGASRVGGAVRRGLEDAAANIRAFHEPQRRASWCNVEPDRISGQLLRPLDSVGVYVPGGTAAYPSTLMMAAIPARVAGVPYVAACTPARRDGTIADEVLAAAEIAGIDALFAVGGAQAIAAMAYGTESVPRVDKVVGPGNRYVNAAKQLLWGTVDMDMLAGPSEVCVVADEGANPEFAALDLLTQAEHAPDTAAYLITPSHEVARAVAEAIEAIAPHLPRADVLAAALSADSALIVARDLEECCDLANVCAPEHLALMVRDPFAYLGRIRNAGAVLLGDYAPQSLGDYLAGPSHTLPTAGTARFASPLNVDDFVKKSSFIYRSAAGVLPEVGSIAALARSEGFEAHARGAEARLKGAGNPEAER